MTEQYDAWKANTHHADHNDNGTQAECVDCHFLPGEHKSLKAKYEGLRHLAAYLYDKDAPLPIRPIIPDGSCLQAGCHDKQSVASTEIQFTEKVRFKHDVHFGEDALNGQPVFCSTCHMKVSEEKHFEVPADICFLCHLKLDKPVLETAQMAEVGIDRILEISFADRPSTDFNQGASRCEICHTIPTEPLQRQLTEEDMLTKEVITHQTITEASVPCESCHFEIVKGAGDIIVGNVVSNGCLRCHNRSEELVRVAEDERMMHDRHIPTRKAACFDCHNAVEHKNRTDHLDFVRNDCQLCHADQHKFQKLLLAGTPVDENLSSTPHLMFDVNVNCLGCHLKKTVSEGHAVRSASGDTCIACHTDRHGEMLENWGVEVAHEVSDVAAFEKEVAQMLEDARGDLGAETYQKIEGALNQAKDLLDIVRVGNGVHNKKYSIMIIDEVFGKLDEVVDSIDSASGR